MQTEELTEKDVASYLGEAIRYIKISFGINPTMADNVLMKNAIRRVDRQDDVNRFTQASLRNETIAA